MCEWMKSVRVSDWNKSVGLKHAIESSFMETHKKGGKQEKEKGIV